MPTNTTNPDRELAATIRQDVANDDELRASLKTYGWSPEFPAIADEFGTVLVGNRRVKIANEEGIEPRIKTIQFGDGKEADAERIKLALISNLGAAPLSPKDRKRIAEHLYGERQWTMERIGKALNVTAMTVSNDLASFKPPLKPSRPKGGRPKGSGTKPKPASKADPHERGVKAEAREERAALLADAGLSTKEIAAEMGLGERAVSQALEHVQIKRDAEEKTKSKLPEIKLEDLSLNERQKAEAWRRAREREFDVKVEQLVRARMRKEIEELILPHYHKKEAEYDEVIAARKGIWTRAEFNLIRSALHPDSRKSISDDRLSRAFQMFEKRELVLVKEPEQPLKGGIPLPRNYAEWEKRRAEVAAKRRARRAAGRDVPSRR